MKKITTLFSSRLLDKKDLAVTILLLAIVGYGFFLRAYGVTVSSLWIDEGYTVMQERAIAAHGYPLLLSGYSEIKDVLLPYVLAGLDFAGMHDVFLFRIVSVAGGVLAVLAMYLVGKELFGKHIALVSSFLMSFSYWHIAWSRQIRAYSIFVALVLLAVFFLVRYEKQRENKHLSAGFVFLLLAILAKSNSGILLLPAFIAYVFLKRKYALLAAGGAALALLSLFFKKTLLDALSLSAVNYLPYYLVGYLWGYFGIIFVFGVVGFYLASKLDRKALHIHVYNALCFAVPLIFFSFFSYVNQKRYLLFVTPFIFLYAAYFICHVSSGLMKKNKASGIILVLLAVIAIDAFTAKSLAFLPKEEYALEKYTPQPDFNRAYGLLKNEMANGGILLSPYPYMDIIYLGKADYALEISYTGRKDDSSLHRGREFYTGVKSIASAEELDDLRKTGDVYVTLDSMALSRIDPSIYAHIRKDGIAILEENSSSGQGIYVYRLGKL